MPKLINDEEEVKVLEVKTPVTTKVTSTKTIDFPALGWAMRAGEECELPVDADAQKIILSNQFISVVK